MSFWDGEKCEQCGHAVVGRRVTLHRVVKRKHVLFENVLAGVCPHCGARFFSANVLKTIQEGLRSRRKAEREVSVPVHTL